VNKRELVQQAQRGDHDAFAVLTDTTVARLDAAARLILRDPDAAKDAVQDAYIRAWRDLRSLRDPDLFDRWLHRLLANSCRDQLRRTRRRPVEVDLADVPHPATPDAYASWADRDELERGFRSLKPEQRALIVIHYYLGLPLPEAAAMLGVPLGTAKSRLHYALQALRAAIDAGARPASTPEGRSR
jgi:RNA polymerase sigma-70 factor (ECF subfamily)